MNNKLCIFGDGDIQLRLYDDVKQYLIHNTPVVRMGSQDHGKSRVEIIKAQSPKFDIIVVKQYVQNLELITNTLYQVYVKNNESNNTYNHRGTVAKMIYDLLKQNQTKAK